MVRKKEEAEAEKQASQDGKTAARCQRGRLEVKEATVSAEYENPNNSMKEMSRGGGSIKENNNNKNTIIKRGGPPEQRERTTL